MKRNILITIIFFALFFTFFLFKLPHNRKEAAERKANFFDMSFNGRIIEISTNRGLSKVKLNNMSRYIYINNSRNYSLTPYSLGDYLSDGMTIYKHAFSDTLFIENRSSNTTVFFIIGNINLNSK